MQARKIEKDIAKTLTALAATGALLKGSVSKVTLGNKIRTPGQRVAYLLTYKGEGNTTKSLYIRKDQVAEVKRMIRNYQKLKIALGKLLELNVKLFKSRQMAAKGDAQEADRKRAKSLA